MTRRLWLRLVGALAATWPLTSVRALTWAQSQPQATLDARTLLAIADVVLPSSLTADERGAAVIAFTEWVGGHKAGVDAGHSYGNSQLRTTGPSPASTYPAQLIALDTAARAEGAAGFAALPNDGRRRLIEGALNAPTRVTQLPARPSSGHVIADFMGHYFHGPDGYNLAYRAAINREDCRGLDGSERRPDALPERARRV